MDTIKTFQDMEQVLRKQQTLRKIVVVCPHDHCTEEVVRKVLQEGIAHFTLVAEEGHVEVPRAIAADFPHATELLVAPTADDAAAMAVALIREGKGDVLMKGMLNTDNFLRAVLKKEIGLLPAGAILTHLTVASTPHYPKLILFSDPAVIPRPELVHFRAMVQGGCSIAQHLGIEEPRIALIHCTEKVSEKFPHTLDYVQLKEEAAAGKFGKVLIDGPMDAKTACDKHSGDVKGISSPVVGNADMLIFPNIESANTFYKTLSFFGEATMAGTLVGTMVPVILPSRSDSTISKYYSLALACLIGNKK